MGENNVALSAMASDAEKRHYSAPQKSAWAEDLKNTGKKRRRSRH